MSVNVLPGRGRVTGPNTMTVDVEGRDHVLEFDALLVCTGASPFVPPFAHPDGNRVLTTRQVFDLRDLPEHLVVLGAGPTGCEFADFFSRCGSRVTLISARDQILPNDDPDLAEVLEEVFLKRGMDILKNGRASAIDTEDPTMVRSMLEDGRELDVSHVLLCIGMRPNTQGLGLEAAGVEFGDRGTLPIDEFCRTNVDHVYACGDVTGTIMLANTAAMHGRTAAMHALGVPVDPVAYTGVAWCVFTRPEIAKAGLSERQARLDGTPVRVTKHLIRANPRAVMESETDGIIKLLSDPDGGTVLGGAMVGLRASEVITTVALAVHAQLIVQALAETAAVNPSMSESLQRTAEKAAEGMLGISRVTLPARATSGSDPVFGQTSMRRPGWAISIGPSTRRAPSRCTSSLPFSAGTWVRSSRSTPARAASRPRLGRVHVPALARVVGRVRSAASHTNRSAPWANRASRSVGAVSAE